MSTEVGTAYVRILPSAKGFSSALRGDVEPASVAAGKKGGGAFSSAFMAPLKALAAPLAVAFGGRAVINGIKGATTAASDLGESINAVQVAYGDAANGILDLSVKSSQAVGLSRTDFNAMAVQFSAFATTIAGDGGDVVGTLGNITGRAADFASVFNIEVSDATSLFQSGLAGETEPLRKFGIDLSAASVNAYAYANGLAEPGKVLTQQQSVQARYAMLMDQTAKTQGDFANTSGGLENTLRRLGAKWKDVQAAIGQAFLPVATATASFMETKLIPIGEAVGRAISGLFSGDMSGAAGRFSAAISTITGAVRGIWDVLSTGNLSERFREVFQGSGGEAFGAVLQGIRDTALSLWDALMTGVANLRAVWDGVLFPMLVRVGSLLKDNVAPGFAALAAFFTERVVPGVQALVAAYMENLHPALMKVIGVVGVLTGVLAVVFSWIWGKIVPVILNLAGPVFSFLITVIARVFTVVGTLITVLVNVATWVARTATAVWNFATSAINAAAFFKSGVVDRVSSVVSFFTEIPGKIVRALGNPLDLLFNVGKDIVRGLANGLGSMLSWVKDKARDLAGGIVDAAKSALRIGSPSKVFIEIGRDVGAGLAIGLDDTGAVDAATRSLVGTVADGFVSAQSVAPAFTGAPAAGRGAGRTFNLYAPLTEQIDALRRAERYDDILEGAL